MSTSALYLFDLDDTLIHGYLGERKGQPFAHVEVMPGRRERLAAIAAAQPDARFGIVTNQAGVAYGYNTVEDVQAKLRAAVAALHSFHGQPHSVHVCYSHPSAPARLGGQLNPYRAEDRRRKPGPGMLLEAMAEHGVSAERTVFVGDLPTDRQAADAAGVRYIDAAEFFPAAA